MTTLQSRIADLISALGTDWKNLWANTGDKADLSTTDKSDLVAAINEVNAKPVVVPDGDKGDITVSASGAAWAVDNDAVTYAKIQNVSATDRFLGRDTAGAGDIEEISPSAARTILNVADGATANDTDANLKARANHTGTQIASTISDFNEAAQDAVGTVLTDTATVDLTYNDVGNAITADVINDSITYAKMQNVSATARVLGRKTAAAGDAEELTAADVRTLINVADGATANSSDAVLEARANHTGTQSADTLTDGTTNKAFLATERTKLSGVATAATANDTDANLKARANHTGTQTASTISDFNEAAQDAVGGALTDTATVDFTYDDSGNAITADVKDNSVTYAKMQDVSATSRVLGRVTAGAGDTEELTAAQIRTLINVADGATANDTDANLKARANHTGTQLASTVSDFTEAAQDAVGSALTDTATVDLTYNDAGNAITADVINDSITYAKIQNVSATDRFLGRDTAGAGDVEEISPSAARTILNVADGATANSSDATLEARANHTGTQLASTISDFTEASQDAVGGALTDTATVDLTYNDGANTITADVINDSITYAKIQNVSATSRVLGRQTAAAGDIEELTAANVRTLINVADGATANSSDATLEARANHTGTQIASTISDFNEAAQDAVGTVLTDTATIDFTYDDSGNAITADVKDNSVTLAKIVDVVTASILGRVTAGTGDPEVLTAAQVRTLLGLPVADVQIFTVDGTWTKPTTGVSVVHVICVGGGGGGGAGRRGATATARVGGGGGGGGGVAVRTIPASACGVTESITVGVGGSGAVGTTANDTNGLNGTSAATASYFGTASTGHVATVGSTAGSGGQSGAGGTAGLGGKGTITSGDGGIASTSGAVGSQPTAAEGPSGGGGGGGVNTSNVAASGGHGGTIISVSRLKSSGASGNATKAADAPANSGEPGYGGGGGGGNASTTAGNGADGALYGGGGGGGGGSLNGFTSGAGGNGGNGIVIVISQ